MKVKKASEFPFCCALVIDFYIKLVPLSLNIPPPTHRRTQLHDKSVRISSFYSVGELECSCCFGS